METNFSKLLSEAYNAIMQQDLSRLKDVLSKLEETKKSSPISEKELVEMSCLTDFPLNKAIKLHIGKEYISLYYETGYGIDGCRMVDKHDPLSGTLIRILLRFSHLILIEEEPES